MRKIAANYIFPVTSHPIKNGIIVIDDFGKIIEIIDNKGNLTETANVEFYNGVLVPGFVNSHCHLELSYLQNKIPTNIGLVNFIKYIASNRKHLSYDEELALESDFSMFKSGINVVADISNTVDTKFVKSNSKITYHTFVELIGLSDNLAENVFSEGIKTYDNFDFPKSIVPHAPYTVSRKLFQKINDFSRHCEDTKQSDKSAGLFHSIRNDGNVMSIHNQETESENLMFENGVGEMLDFVSYFENNFNEYIPTQKSSLKSYFPFISRNLNILLIHNIFTSENDIDFAENYSKNIYWCVCPNSNLYIQNRLPDIELLYRKKLKICIGTDSLASNLKLDILDEIKIIQKHFPSIPFNEILKWATINGANAINLYNNYGSLEVGKSPGILLLENFDFVNMNLKTETKVRRLV